LAYILRVSFSFKLIDCDGRMANVIGTGVTVPDFRHVAHHSLFENK
jgi:hypothetical protein